MKLITIIIAFLIISQHSFCQDEYNKYILTSSADAITNIRSYKQSDIDGDGDLDLFITSNSTEYILWLKNTDGVYTKVDNSLISNMLTSKQINDGDIDNDGDNDIVYAYDGPGFIVWKVNTDGKGTFSGKVLISNYTGELEDLILIDIDNDNDLDIVYKTNTLDGIAIHKNIDGTGQFETKQTIEFGSDIESIDLGDLNNDNYPELVILKNGESEVSYYINDGGSFEEKIVLTDSYGVCENINVVDLDNNNYLDIVFSSEENNSIYSFLNSDGMTFQEVPLLENTLDFTNYDLKHINEDDLIDITAYKSSFGDKFLWWENKGNNNIFEMDSTSVPVTSLYGSNPRLDDFNGDGVADLALTYSDKIQLNINNGFGDFGKPFSITPYFNENATFVRFVDFDNDEDLDIVTNGALLINVDGIYSTMFENDLATFRFELADLDGDGFQDVVSMVGITKLSQYKNHNGKSLELVDNLISFATNGIFDLELVDWDMDGDIDVLTRANSHIYWFENDGLGNFGSWQSLVSDCWCRFTTGDIDGDNDIDILAGNKQTNKLAWYRQLEDGTLSDQHTISNTSIGDRFLADIDGDGDLDAICQGSTSIEWYQNSGSGGFSGPNNINLSPSSYTDLKAMDMDNDGDMDLAYLSREINEIGWFEYVKEDADFTVKHIVSSDIGEGRFFDVADIDGDSIPDIVSVALDREQVELYTSKIYTNVMHGNIEIDLDGLNCNATDESLFYFITSGNINSSDKEIYLTKRDGSFSFEVPNGTYYSEFSSSLPPNYLLKSDTIYSTFSEYGGEYYNSFCIESIENKSILNISMMPRDGYLINNLLSYIINLQNTGNQVENGKFQISYNSNALQPISSSLPFTILEDGIIEFNIEGLDPLNFREIELDMQLISPSQTEPLSYVVEYIGDDDISDDDLFSFYHTPSSVTPNSILTINSDIIAWDDKDEYIYYMLRFQNTSSNLSPNLDIQGEINQNFDISSLQILDMSHDFTVSILERMLTVNYNDLLQSQPDDFEFNLESGGYVFFRLKPDSLVENSSELKIDFNIDFNNGITSTASSSKFIEDYLSDKEINAIDRELSIIPNPVIDFMDISLHNLDEYEKGVILDMNGAEVVQLNNLKGKIDIKKLISGVYILKVISSKGTKSLQFVKM